MEILWLAVVFALPLVFFPTVFTTFELAKTFIFQGAATLLLLLWILKCFFNGSGPVFERKSHRFLWVSLAIFLGFYLLATVFSVAPALSVFGWYPRFQGLLAFFSYIVFGFVLFFELKTEKQRERFILAVLLGFVLACLMAMMQKFLPGFLQWWNDAEFNGRIYGTMANPNYLAGYIVIVAPLALGNIFRKKFRWFSVFCLLLGVTALLLTLSRAGFLAFFLSVVFLLGAVAYRRKAMKTLVALVILPLVAAGFVWFVIAHQQEDWVTANPFLNRITTNEENVSSAQSRLEIWPAAVKQILASPFIGFGPETFAVSFPAYAPSTVNTREDMGEIVDHAHNELLDMAVQTGIPGMLAYLCFLAGLVAAGGGYFLNKKGSDSESWLVLGLSSSILGLFIANEFGFSVTVHWVLFAAFAAVMLNIIHQKEMREIPYRVANWLKGLLFALVALLSIGMFWVHDVNLVLADATMRQGYDAILAGDLPTTAQYYQAAAQTAPVEAFYSLNLAYVDLQRLYDEQKLTAVEILDAYGSALHASRLRGYDSFSLSVAQELHNTF